MGTEVITYSRIGKQDIRFGTGTYEVVLADGRKVILDEVDIGAILQDSTVSSPFDTATWTPAITFVTPGNLSVSYAVALGTSITIGKLVRATFSIVTSAFTHTTASGNLRITGLDTTAQNPGFPFPGSLAFQGITKANYTQFTPYVANGAAYIQVSAGGSGQSIGDVAASDMPTGGTVWLFGSVIYQAA